MGRGEYYRNKYGGGGRGTGRGRGGGRDRTDHGNSYRNNSNNPRAGGGSYADLMRLLSQIDGSQYPRYHDLETATKGWHNSECGFTLFVGRAQSDPFAPPTRCRVSLSRKVAMLPSNLYSNHIRATATSDYLLRKLYDSCRCMGADASLNGNGWSGPKGGDIQIMAPCQHILEQSAVFVDKQTGDITVQLTINLPARGRTILGKAAAEILKKTLPALMRQSLYYSSLDAEHLKHHVDSIEDQHWLQQQLAPNDLVAFVRNGSILPRATGADDRPMSQEIAIPFKSPDEVEVTFTLPTLGTRISGMGIPKGVTLICGGGFHGKSTLLQALQLGVYLKIPGDGREFCVTSPSAIKIRAEDGRCVTAVDISPFINNLPFGKDTTNFSSPDASGSTSQASNIVESIEAGADTLLIDEDTAATNFMIRDDKMMQLVATEKEPITPFVQLVRPLYQEIGLSSILVIGGSGDFFSVADQVLVMDCYNCHDATTRAKAIANQSKSFPPGQQQSLAPGKFQKIREGGMRFLAGNAYNPGGKVKVVSKTVVSYGDVEIDLSGLEQLVSKAQTNTISSSLQKVASLASCDGNISFEKILSQLEQLLERNGFDSIAPSQMNGALAKPRRLEIAGAINRLRRSGNITQR